MDWIEKKVTVKTFTMLQLQINSFEFTAWILDPYNVFLAIATNVPVLLKTGFVVQDHIFTILLFYCVFDQINTALMSIKTTLKTI